MLSVLSTVIADTAKNGGNVIIFVVMLIECGAFTLFPVYPQWTNIIYNPENCADKRLHIIRRGCVTGKLALVAALLISSVFASL